MLVALGCAAAWWTPSPAAAAPAAEVALARQYAPVVRLTGRSGGSCGIDVPYKPMDVADLMGNDEIALRGPWDTTNLVGVAPTAGGSRGACGTTTSTSPATRSARAAPTRSGPSAWRPAHGVRAGRDGARRPREARAPVLVLLRLQRLEQHPRGRLGDDPARLRRRDAPSGRSPAAGRGGLQPALQRRAGRVGRRQARAGERHAPGRLPGCRVAGQLLRLAALSDAQRRRGRRLRRHERTRRGRSPRP